MAEISSNCDKCGKKLIEIKRKEFPRGRRMMTKITYACPDYGRVFGSGHTIVKVIRTAKTKETESSKK